MKSIHVLCLVATISISAQQQKYNVDEHGNQQKPMPATEKLFVGLEAAVAAHGEEGLDRSKGEYSVSYATLGGAVTAQYHLTDFFFDAGIGLMRLMTLTVNKQTIDMSNRTQWHLPLYTHAYYKLDPLFALGAGLTHITEMTMYVDSQPAPESSYNHLFIDIAAQLTPPIGDTLRLTMTAILGLNVIPGRQNIYTVTDLLHYRFQFNLGLLYRLPL